MNSAFGVLRQDRPAEAFGISRGELRGSLRELAGEKPVELEARKGAVVASLSVDELDEPCGIAGSPEEYALDKAVPAMTDGDVAAMQALLDRMAAEADPAAWYGLNVAFHRRLVLASGLNRVLRTTDAVRWTVGRSVADPRLFAAQRANWLGRNRELLEACRARDLDAALRALDEMRCMSTAAVRRHRDATGARDCGDGPTP